MTSNNPISIAGKVFDEYALHLAISPLYKTNFMSSNVVMTLTPCRRENGEFEVLQDPNYKKSIIVSDIFESNDQQIMVAVGKVQSALQELINLKGL